MNPLLNSVRCIDLREEEKGSLCLLCEDFPAQLWDADIGAVCLDCAIELLRAERGLICAHVAARKGGRYLGA